MVSSLVLWKGNSEAPSLWFRSGSQCERGHNGNQLYKAPCLELFLLPSLLFPSLSHFYSWGVLPNKLLATKSSSAWTKPGATSLPQHESSPKERASAGKFLNLGTPSLPCHTCAWPLLTRLGPRLPAFFSRCLVLLPGIAMASLTSAFQAPNPESHVWMDYSFSGLESFLLGVPSLLHAGAVPQFSWPLGTVCSERVPYTSRC